MKRSPSVFPILLLACLAGVAQPTGPLRPEKADGSLWLKHTVAPKENWYSVARIYHIGPRDIAAFNETEIAKPLAIGQTLRIPLTEANFTQTGSTAPDEVLVPLYHVVAGKEGLFRIGQDYNRIGIEQLKALNGLGSDAIRSGMRLVVGYLKVGRDQREWAGRTVAPPAAAGKANAGGEVTRTTEVKTPSGQVKTPDTGRPAPRRDTSTVRTGGTTRGQEPLRNRVDTGIAPGGYFATLYAQQSRSGTRAELTGVVASFKSTSGWKDGKYYLLMNGVPPGTVVRVTDALTGRSVHAKVLGDLPPIRENEKVAARISNAALSALELAEGSHELRLEWMKS
jgi:LysM repeat protein